MVVTEDKHKSFSYLLKYYLYRSEFHEEILSMFMQSLINVLFLMVYKVLNMQYLNKHSWKNNSSLLLPSPVIRVLPTVTLKHNVKVSEAQEQKLLQQNASSA